MTKQDTKVFPKITEKSKYRWKKSLPFILSFLLPTLLWCGSFAYYGIYPFGSEQAVIMDGWHQYFPFLFDFLSRIKQGSSLLWSWTNGGTDYLAQMTYYTTSPFNLLLLIFPQEFYREITTWLIPLKMGLAGLFMSFSLSKHTNTKRFSLAFFATLYATCGWAVGYYWNIIWIDSFILFPLILMGFQALIRERKWKLYTFSLSLAILANFLIGLYICIFLVLMFALYCFNDKPTKRDFLQNIKDFILYSLLAGALLAAILLPTYVALQATSRGIGNQAPLSFEFYDPITDVFGNMLVDTSPTRLTGLANWYSGMVCIILFGLFLFSKAIKWKEKLSYTLLLIFLVISTEINYLYYTWNGFNNTASLPGRFTFIFTFLIITIAFKIYNSFDVVGKLGTFEIIICLCSGILMSAFLLQMGYFGSQNNIIVSIALIFCILYIISFSFLLFSNKGVIKKIFSVVAMTLIVFEAILGLNAGSREGNSTSWFNYPPYKEEVATLLQSREDNRPNFYRTEVDWGNQGRSSLYQFEGFSLFSSTVDSRLVKFLKSQGWYAMTANNTYSYNKSSPLAELITDIKYKIVFSKESEAEKNWSVIDQSENCLLLKNDFYLPLGFITNKDLQYYSTSIEQPFEAQNRFFTLATAIDQELFSIVEDANVEENGCVTHDISNSVYHVLLDTYALDGQIEFQFKLPEEGDYFFYCGMWNEELTKAATVFTDESMMYSLCASEKAYITPLGACEKSEIIRIRTSIDRSFNSFTVCVAKLNEDVLEAGYLKLANETLDISEFQDTYIKGSITTKGGLLYTSIPYTKNWKAYVNGKETDIILVGDCMMSLALDAGTHTIEFRYLNTDFIVGCIISGIAAAILILLILRDRKQKLSKIVEMKGA